MSLLKQIDDRSSVLEWSPYAERANMVALATSESAGAGFDEYGGELEIHQLDFAAKGSKTGAPVGSVKARYDSLAYIPYSCMSANKILPFPFPVIYETNVSSPSPSRTFRLSLL